jgi:hypothetical protein
MEKAREHHKNVCLYFIDYSKAFDSGENLKMWNSVRNMGIPEHLIVLIRDLYTEQESKVRVEQGITEWFPIKRGVRQGCILSPGLFSIYSEYTIRTAGLKEMEAGVRIGGQMVNNL